MPQQRYTPDHMRQIIRAIGGASSLIDVVMSSDAQMSRATVRAMTQADAALTVAAEHLTAAFDGEPGRTGAVTDDERRLIEETATSRPDWQEPVIEHVITAPSMRRRPFRLVAGAVRAYAADPAVPSPALLLADLD